MATRGRLTYTKASPVTVTKADGSVEVQKALPPNKLFKVIGEGNKRRDGRDGKPAALTIEELELRQTLQRT